MGLPLGGCFAAKKNKQGRGRMSVASCGKDVGRA